VLSLSGIHYGEAGTKTETWDIRIESETDIGAVRQKVRELIKEHRFDPFAGAALTTAASELSRNIWQHAGNGVAHLRVLINRERVGLELEFVDHGPGIPDVDRVFEKSFGELSKSPGLGLQGTRRLVDEFEMETKPGVGTRVVIRKWKKDF
jgi:serine/threonine-protein kinase RsbT